MKPHLEGLGLGTFPAPQADLRKFALWTHQHPAVILHLFEYTKVTTLPVFYKSSHMEIKSRYEDHESLFTDVSKDKERTGFEVCSNADTYSCSPPDGATLFSAELNALLLALEHISRSQNDNYTIFFGSHSASQALDVTFNMHC